MPNENIFQDGPFLTAALLCERLLEEKDGVKSSIRIVNRIISSTAGPGAPEAMPSLQTNIVLFLSMRTGKKAGKHKIRIKLVKPDGISLPDSIHDVNLEPPEDRGIDLKIFLDLRMDKEGLYWFEVYFDEFFMTKIPLRIIYLRQTQGSTSAPLAVQ